MLAHKPPGENQDSFVANWALHLLCWCCPGLVLALPGIRSYFGSSNNEKLQPLIAASAIMADAAGLFGCFPAAAGAPSAGAETHDAAGTRRTKLFPYDSAAAQLLNPYGSSTVSTLTPQALWSAVKKGNKKAAFHSELAAKETTGGEYRVGVGISRTAGTLVEAIDKLKSDHVKALIKEDLWKKAMDEADTLLPHLQRLNAGKGTEGNSAGGSSFAALKKRRANPSDSAGSLGSLDDASAAVHAWFRKPQSPLRGILSILSADGAFYSGHVAEKVARSWIEVENVKEDQFLRAAKARHSGKPIDEDVRQSSDHQGLFG